MACLSCLFDYETPRMIVIRSKVVGSFFRLIQFLIISYVIGYVCVVQKSYQEYDSVLSSVTTKVKGTGFTNISGLGANVWDVADYNIPPQGKNYFFVLTNMIVTPNQTQTRCPELPKESTICMSDSDCTKGSSDVRGNGIQTGLCVNYSETVKTCEVLSWCPLETDISPPQDALLAAAENFTVLIKNSVTYPKFNFHKRNILPDVNSSYLKKCEFNRTTDPHCPIFRLKDMVTEAGEDFQTMAVMISIVKAFIMDIYDQYYRVWVSFKAEVTNPGPGEGGILGIIIDWSCDLNWSERHCVPRYSFRRMDNKNPENNVAPGYNFRFSKYYKNPEDKETRTLIKAYGIRFDVIVFGMAGKFNIVPTIVNVSAALTFLSLVHAICDWILLTFTKKKNLYHKHIFAYLDETDLDAGESLEGTTYGTQ